MAPSPEKALPYGTWPTPITAGVVVRASVSLGGPAVSPDGRIWWSELRPTERGRTQVVVKALDAPPSAASDLLPDGYSARSRVHEYGGTSFWVGHGALVFANTADQRLYRIDRPGERDQAEPVAITPDPVEPGALRYIDLSFTPDGRWAVCVREEHGRPGTTEPVNEIVAMPLDGSGDPVVVVSGPDFTSHPRVSPDGTRLSWLQWSHPNMPWDESELWVADLTSGAATAPSVTGAVRVAGGAGVSIAQPSWTPAGQLAWVTDEGGSWELVVDGVAVTGLGSRDDTGVGVGEQAQAQWVFGQSWYAWAPEATEPRLVGAVRRRDGRDWCAAPELTAVDGVVATGRGTAALIGASFTAEAVVAEVGPGGELTVHRPARDLGLGPAWFSVPEHITFPTTDLGTGVTEAHALFYRPTNPDVPGAPDPAERPPLLVLSHGGPTSAARPLLQLSIQYWTSRGFAVADVNYRGSTGYGRAYRDALAGTWGIADVDDCIACARHLAAAGEVDPDRLAIKGGSAGGFTTLCALAFHATFRAGSCLYGVADLETLATDTHKFEARYLDRLVGPYPEAAERYRARSPIHHLDGLNCPVILFQGLDDKVVPPSQSEQIVAALRRRGLPFAYLAFEGEEHGFRQAATIERVLESEHYFLARVFGFDPPAGVEPVTIENEGSHGQ